jgi:Type I restriction enzyme R protein N terminus (HSDR_N)
MTMDERFRPDIIISDRNSHAIIIVEVKAGAFHGDERSALDQLRRYVTAFGDADTFSILANPEQIRIYRGAPADDADPIVLATSDILRHYDAEYDARGVYEPYLASLVEAWLNDLSIHWQSEHPPGEHQLPEQLVSRLQAA